MIQRSIKYLLQPIIYRLCVVVPGFVICYYIANQSLRYVFLADLLNMLNSCSLSHHEGYSFWICCFYTTGKTYKSMLRQHGQHSLYIVQLAITEYELQAESV